MRRLIVCLSLAAGCTASQLEMAPAPEVPVESWQSVDVASLNARVDEAAAGGAAWPASPLNLTVELFGGDVDTRILSLAEQNNRGEGADTTVVVMVRDGFLDDSIRGDWHRIVYRRLPDGTWRLHEVRRAYRCWRGHHQEAFSSQPCL